MMEINNKVNENGWVHLGHASKEVIDLVVVEVGVARTMDMNGFAMGDDLVDLGSSGLKVTDEDIVFIQEVVIISLMVAQLDANGGCAVEETMEMVTRR